MNTGTDLDDIDTVWLLWAPTHFVVWSSVKQAWINILFEAMDTPNAPNLHRDSDFELLQDVESTFLASIGNTTGSPYVFTITAGHPDDLATDK